MKSIASQISGSAWATVLRPSWTMAESSVARRRASSSATAHRRVLRRSGAVAAHAAWAGEGVLDFGHIPSPAQWRSDVLAVTDADILSVAREIFINQKPAIAEIGPT